MTRHGQFYAILAPLQRQVADIEVVMSYLSVTTQEQPNEFP